MRQVDPSQGLATMNRQPEPTGSPHSLQAAVAFTDRATTVSVLPSAAIPLKWARAKAERLPALPPFDALPLAWLPLHLWGVGLLIPRSLGRHTRTLVELVRSPDPTEHPRAGHPVRELRTAFGTFGQALGTAWLLRAGPDARVALAFRVQPARSRGRSVEVVFLAAPAVGGDDGPEYVRRVIARLDARFEAEAAARRAHEVRP